MLKRLDKSNRSGQLSAIALLVMLVILFIQADRRYGYTSKEEKEYVNVVSDGTGYYAYLPQYIVYPDQVHFAFHDSISKKYPDKQFFSMLSFDTITGQAYDKFYIGTALVQTPFYLAGHLYASASGTADGYSKPYRLSIQFAALFYWLIGAIALLRLFQRMGYSRLSILTGIVILTFGTNLNLYTAYYVSLSHTYSFGLIACFLNVFHHWATTHKTKSLLWGVLLFGLIAVIRPVNVLIVLIVPFFFTSFPVFLQRLRTVFSDYRVPLAGFLLTALPVLLQLLAHHHQTGRWSLYTYSEEGFDHLFSPQFFKVLFSYEKGFFVYAPALFLLFPALYFFARHSSRYFLLGWSLTALVTLYMVCSWWSWEYGGGLGMRPLIEFMPLYAFPLLALFRYSGRFLRILAFIFAGAGILFYQVFQIQFNKNILLYSGMNKARFMEIFLKTDDRFKWMLAYDYEQLPDVSLQPYRQYSLTHDGWKVANDSVSPSLLLRHGDVQFPFYARLNGSVTVHDQANNPSIETLYYQDGQVIASNTQPFGNQVPTVGKPADIRLEFNRNIENADSIRITYLPHGKSNTLEQVTLTLLHQ